MRELLQWHDSWELGIDHIDADHREMVRRMNRLAAAEPDQVDQAFEFLLEHLRLHFEREEQFLVEIDYPDKENHSAEHRMELAELIELRRELARRHPAHLEPDELDAIKQCFFNHAIAEDRRFAVFYRQRDD